MRRRRKGYSEDTKVALLQMADDLAQGSIVTQVLARYLYQVMEFVTDEYIAPLQDRAEEQQTRIAELEHQVRALGGKL